MLDRERLLAKLDEVDGYLHELEAIRPKTFAEYQRIETKRACERLLQIAVESVIDVCGLLIAGLRLGLPAEEDDLFEKLERAGVVSAEMRDTLKRRKGCRNILVHEYGQVADEMIFEIVTSKLGDFRAFRRFVIDAIQRA